MLLLQYLDYAYQLGNPQAFEHFAQVEGQTKYGVVSQNASINFTSGESIDLSTGKAFVLDEQQKQVRQLPMTTSSYAVNELKSACHLGQTGMLMASSDLYFPDERIIVVGGNEADLWNKELAFTGDVSQLKLIPLDDASALIAMNFTDKVTYEEQTFESRGGEDILFLAINLNGELISARQFGSAGNESVEGIIHHNNLLYFGGNYDGAIESRQIGNLEFGQTPYAYQEQEYFTASVRPYLSFISIGELLQIAALERPAPIPDREEIDIVDLGVFPNPTTGLVTFKIPSHYFSDTKAEIIIYDLGGKALQTVDVVQSFIEGPTQVEIDCSSLPNGIYIYSISTGNNQLIYPGRIVLIHK